MLTTKNCPVSHPGQLKKHRLNMPWLQGSIQSGHIQELPSEHISKLNNNVSLSLSPLPLSKINQSILLKNFILFNKHCALQYGERKYS